jgi:hypothetical protein
MCPSTVIPVQVQSASLGHSSTIRPSPPDAVPIGRCNLTVRLPGPMTRAGERCAKPRCVLASTSDSTPPEVLRASPRHTIGRSPSVPSTTKRLALDDDCAVRICHFERARNLIRFPQLSPSTVPTEHLVDAYHLRA